MSLALSDLRETVRFLLGDRDPAEPPMFEDSAVDAALRSVVRLRRVPDLALTSDRASVTPTPTADQTALLCLHTAKLWLAGDPDRYEYRKRALSEKFGGNRNALDELEQSIHLLENGAMFSGWVLFGNWLAGHGGLDVAAHWTEMTGTPPNRTLAYPSAEP